MSTNYPPPEPAAFALLKNAPALASPGQQAILAEFGLGQIGIETTVYRLIQEVKERFPAVKAAREAAGYERATRAREQREMAENEQAAGPTFVEYTPEGRPVNEAALLSPFLRVGVVATPAVGTVAGAVAMGAPETVEAEVEAPAADEGPPPTAETSGGAPVKDDSNEDDYNEAEWVSTADEQVPDHDD